MAQKTYVQAMICASNPCDGHEMTDVLAHVETIVKGSLRDPRIVRRESFISMGRSIDPERLKKGHRTGKS